MSDNNHRTGISRFANLLGHKPAIDVIPSRNTAEMEIGYEAARLPSDYVPFDSIAEARKGVRRTGTKPPAA